MAVNKYPISYLTEERQHVVEFVLPLLLGEWMGGKGVLAEQLLQVHQPKGQMLLSCQTQREEERMNTLQISQNKIVVVLN